MTRAGSQRKKKLNSIIRPSPLLLDYNKIITSRDIHVCQGKYSEALPLDSIQVTLVCVEDITIYRESVLETKMFHYSYNFSLKYVSLR